MMNFRIGFGYDVHRMAEGESFWLGGVEIPYAKGTVAHSDGDVLIHAVCDALLGALALKDIGYNFPDTDDAYKNISSKILLKKTYDLIKDKGFVLGNMDATICLQKPKLKDYIPLMIKELAIIMETEEENVSVKATTTEKLGFVGEEKGISAYCNVLIYKSNV